MYGSEHFSTISAILYTVYIIHVLSLAESIIHRKNKSNKYIQNVIAMNEQQLDR